jgi:hypothetical protein
MGTQPINRGVSKWERNQSIQGFKTGAETTHRGGLKGSLRRGLLESFTNNLSKRLIIQHINEFKNGLSIDYKIYRHHPVH